MQPKPSEEGGAPRAAGATKPDLATELLVLPDGRILVHNLTPTFAGLLNELNPADDAIKLRAREPLSPDAGRLVDPNELRPGT